MDSSESNLDGKKYIVLLMCVSLILCLYGQYSEHWINWDTRDEPPELAHASLREIYVGGENYSSFEEISIIHCNFYESYGYELDNSLCIKWNKIDTTGSNTSLLLWISTATGICFLIVAFRSIKGEKDALLLVLLDPRFSLSSGVMAIIGSLYWIYNMNGYIVELEWEIGAGFYTTLIGGILALLSYLMIIRNTEFQYDKAATDMRISERKIKLNESKIKLIQESKDEKLLFLASEAVEAKEQAEAKPEDPLLWLRMAEAMDAANMLDEAKRARKIAIELMEK